MFLLYFVCGTRYGDGRNLGLGGPEPPHPHQLGAQLAPEHGQSLGLWTDLHRLVTHVLALDASGEMTLVLGGLCSHCGLALLTRGLRREVGDHHLLQEPGLHV